MMYMVFYEMEIEMEVRSHVKDKSASETEGVKEKVLEAMKKNKDVKFYWSSVAANWESEEAAVVLDMIMEQWIIIRGFSCVSAFIEQYKKRNKKCTQKSKGLRKTLIRVVVVVIVQVV